MHRMVLRVVTLTWQRQMDCSQPLVKYHWQRPPSSRRRNPKAVCASWLSAMLQPVPTLTASMSVVVQLAPGQVRATLDATLSQSATFSLAMPADATLSSQTLLGGARTGGNPGSPQRQDIRFNRRIHRYFSRSSCCGDARE